MDLTRREFLVAGAAGAIASRSFALPPVVYSGTNGGTSEPIERSMNTLCRQCPGGCGLRSRVVSDSAVGISGNPYHPVNRGGMCARAPAAIQTLYNPDRLTTPLKRDGPKGSGRFAPIDWADAIELLATKLRSVRQAPGPHALAVLINANRGLTRLVWRRFLQAFGSNNLIDWSFADAHQVYPAIWATQGLRRAVGYDFSRTRYVLSFCSQLLDAHWSPAQASAAFAALRREAPQERARLVHIEPRLSITGAKADEWIPIRPGTEGALALGIAHVLLREGLYDRYFVEHLTDGFDDPDGGDADRLGFRRLVLRDYSPARVARITGVEEATVFRLAREFATHRPAIAIGFDGTGVPRQRCYDRMAIHALNALVGSIDVPGGVTHFQEIELLNVPMPEPDRLAEQGLAKPRIDLVDPTVFPLGDIPNQMLAERLLADLPHPVEVLVLAGANPVFDSPHPERMRMALKKVPLVVSLSAWQDDSARWSDLIIPDGHFLTKWDLDVSHSLTGQPAVTVSRPVVQAPQGSHSSTELVLELARRVGESTAAALPFESPEKIVRAACGTLADSGRGGPFGPEEEVVWTRLLERSGWKPPKAASAEKVLAAGGWTDPIYYHREWDRVFRSPPRRFAFYSRTIAERVRPHSAADDLRCLPHYEPLPRDGAERTSLQLYVYPLAILAGMTDANVPWLVDACGSIMGERWRSWIEINPRTAERLHLVDGEPVVVTSGRGELVAHVTLFAGLEPLVGAMPWGLGHDGGGRWIDGVGVHPAAVVDVQTDPLTSGAYWQATRVSLRKL